MYYQITYDRAIKQNGLIDHCFAILHYYILTCNGSFSHCAQISLSLGCGPVHVTALVFLVYLRKHENELPVSKFALVLWPRFSLVPHAL